MKRLLLSLTLLTGSLATAVLIACPPQTARAQNNHQPPSKENKPSDLSGKNQHTETENCKSYQTPANSPAQDDAWIRWGVLVNGILVVFTGVIAFVGGIQAAAARKSAEDADKTARLTQRADVLVECIEMVNAQPFSPDTRVVLRFKNFGPTRASNVVFAFRMDIPGKLGTVFPEPTAITLGAKDGAPFVFKRFAELGIPMGNISQIANGQLQWMFEGTVRYSDVFGKSHTIGYRGDYNFQTGNFNRTETQQT